MDTESDRMWASAAFVGVLIVVGVPLWWKTTEVYRVSLPYDEIAAFKNMSTVIGTEVTVLANDEPTASEIAGLLEQAFEGSDIIKLKITKKVLSNDLHHILNSAADDQQALEELFSALDLEKHNHLYLVQRKPLLHHVWVDTERAVFFRDASAGKTLVSVLKHWLYSLSALEGARSERTVDAGRKTRVSPAAAYTVLLTVAHPRPDLLKVDFDAAAAVEDYIGSFVDDLSVLHNFTLKSQWLHLLDFDLQPVEIAYPAAGPHEYARHMCVSRRTLQLWPTRVEERAATRVSHQHVINLMLYVAPCHLAPVVLSETCVPPINTTSNAVMSPKWGGVYIASPAHSVCSDVTNKIPRWRPNVRVIMGTLIAQLRELIGIDRKGDIEGATLTPLRSVRVRSWEVDGLLRTRALEQITSAKLTLHSLAQLLGEISNIVINDEVGASINNAVEDIETASSLLAAGRLVEAYETSQTAFLEAEAAFTDPTLLALLYFPDDQKYAIYIPLFLPIMFPVVLSLKNLILWLRGKRSTKQKTE